MAENVRSPFTVTPVSRLALLAEQVRLPLPLRLIVVLLTVPPLR